MKSPGSFSRVRLACPPARATAQANVTAVYVNGLNSASLAASRPLDAYVVVQTCKGRSKELNKTLKSIRASDLGIEPRVLRDHEAIEDIGVVETDKYLRIGLANSMALREFLATSHEYLLFMEDDVDINPYLRHNIETWRPFIYGLHYASMFHPIRLGPLGMQPMAQSYEERDFRVADPVYFYGAQCLLISRAAAKATLAFWNKIDTKYPILDRQGPNNVSYALRSPILVHSPGLVHHRAALKSMWKGNSELGKNIGKEYGVGDGSCDLTWRR